MPTKKVVKKVVAKKAVSKPVKKAVSKKVAKKVVAKKSVKKTATKTATTKTAKKSISKKPLVVAPNHASFWVNDGQVLNSLVALRDALDEMEKEVFLYHTAKEQNDFAEWVASVLEDAVCANELAKASTPAKAKTVVTKHLKFYTV